jgi:hypothetical protein
MLADLLREDDAWDLPAVAQEWGVQEREVDELLRRAGALHATAQCLFAGAVCVCVFLASALLLGGQFGARLQMLLISGSQNAPDVQCAALSAVFACTNDTYDAPNTHRQAEGFASLVSAFCEHLGYGEIHAAIRSFNRRVYKSRAGGQQAKQRGALAGLDELRGLKALQGPKARVLFEQGIKTLEQLAALDRAW